MEEKKPFGEKLSDFFAGKGFYIVLLLCAALIATSIWLMTDGSRADVETAGRETEIDHSPAQAHSQPERPGELPVMRVDDPRPAQAQPAPTPKDEAETRDESSLTEPETPAAAEEPEAPARETAAMPAVDYYIWPVNGTLVRGWSAQTLSYDPTMSDWRLHSGWDIAAAEGERVLSTANGVVSAVYADPALGTVVEVSHQGDLVSVYANLAPDCPVSVGQQVSVGSVLGSVGATALYESGEVSHLHFAMRQGGETADPALWLPQP